MIILILVAFCAISLVRSKYGLESSEYEITSAKPAETDAASTTPADTDDIRIVELADLHNAVFGEDNSRLVEMVKSQKPDLILMVGDMVQQDEADLSVVTGLIRTLSEIAPVYFSLGNHEISYMENFPENDLISAVEGAGAIVLDREYKDITVKGTEIRIGGIFGYCLPATEALRKDFRDQPNRLEEMDWLLEYQDTDRLKLLMCHMPVCWIQNGSLEYYDTDVVFAGHAHGGQVRLPFVGGLHAPDQGWFIGDAEGLYTDDGAESVVKPGESVLVLSRGLGSEMKRPRFCNPPQVVTLIIHAEKVL